MSSFTRILSIDGGGIRGVIPGQILVVLEEKIKQRTGNQNAKIADYFDLIAGTSTGGILTCLYLTPDPSNPTRPLFSAKNAVDIYLDRGKDIFATTLSKRITSGNGIFDEKFDSVNIEKVLKEYFTNTKLSQLIKPCLITAYDIQARRSRFFTQHDALKNPEENFLVREVARATSAAPTFFEVAKITSMTNKSYPLIDGGVFANNPTLCAYAEARTKLQRKPNLNDPSTGNPTAKDMVVLSLGTGDIKEAYEYQKVQDWGQLQWVVPLINIIMTGVAETVDFQVKQVFDATQKPEQYLRINCVIPNHSPLSLIDNVNPENVKALRQLGNKTASENSEKLDKFIDFLL